MRFQGHHILKEFEELRLIPYDDLQPNKPLKVGDEIKGTLTVGWGHTGPDVKIGKSITREQAQSLLEKDVAWAERAVNEAVKVGLSQNQFDALVSFTYNIGENKFYKSTLLRLLNAGDYTGAANQLPRWNKSKGKVLQGLITRRAKEMTLFLSPDTGSGKPDELKPLKPMTQSKENLSGLSALIGAATSGVATVLGVVTPENQETLLWAVIVALGVFGLFITANRWIARKNGQR